MLLFFAALAVVVIAAVIAGLLPRLSRQKGLVAAAEEVAVRKPTVIVSEARFGATRDSIDLLTAVVGALPGIVEHDIFGVELVNCCASTRRVIFTKHVMKISGQQG